MGIKGVTYREEEIAKRVSSWEIGVSSENKEADSSPTVAAGKMCPFALW